MTARVTPNRVSVRKSRTLTLTASSFSTRNVDSAWSFLTHSLTRSPNQGGTDLESVDGDTNGAHAIFIRHMSAAIGVLQIGIVFIGACHRMNKAALIGLLTCNNVHSCGMVPVM